jgi:CRP-like cAMP-binding protein/HEAT repeat protein
MGKLLERVFQVRPEERRIVLLFFAFFVGVGMFYTVGATVGDTLFLSNLTPPEVPRMLPLLYLGIAVANVLSALAFDAAQARLSRTNSIIGTQLVLAAGVLLARQLIEAHARPVYFALVIWLEVCSLLSITLFFSFAGDYFSPRDARRLYGFIAGGMSLGTVLSGYAIGLCVGFVGTKNLLYVSSALLLINAGIAALIYRVGKPLATDLLFEEQLEQVSLRAIFSRPYVRLLAAIIPLAVITYVTVDYQMKWIASAKSEEALARFFGSFFGWVGAAQIVFQFVLAQRLLQRLGVISSLMILPLAVGGASALLYLSSFMGYSGGQLLLLSAGVNFLRMTLSETLDLPSRELLLLPLPTRLRRRVQPLMSGALGPAAQGVGALLLLLALRLQLGVHALSLIAVACAALLLVTLVRLRPRYRETLAATLREYQLDATDLEQLLRDPTAEALIESLLRSSDPDVVKATIDLLANRELGKLGATLEELVESIDPEIAIAALQRLAREKDPRCMHAIAQAWSSALPAVRQAAVLALCEASGEAAVPELSQSLDSGDPIVRTSAVIGLGRHGGSTGQALVRPRLLAHATSDGATERVEAARMFGRIGSAGFADLIAPLLRDPVREVRVAAAEACCDIGDPALVEPLLQAMADPELRAAAMRALAAMPPEAVGALSRRLGNSGPLSERCAMARVLGQVGGVQAADALYELVGAPHELSLRLAAAEALRAMRARAVLPPLEQDDYETRIDAVCAALELLVRAAAEIPERDAFATQIFRDHARMHIDLLCCLLALRYDLRAIDRIQYNLTAEPRELGVRALELVDEVLPRRLAPQVVQALQAWLEKPASTTDGLHPETRRELLAAEPWLRVTAVHYLNQGAAYPTIEAAAMSDQDRELYRTLDVVSFLKRVPLLRDLSAYYLLEQAEIAEWHARSAGETLFAQGDKGEALYIICQGEVEVRLGERVVAKLGAGECIGELALLDGEPRSATAVATCDTTLLEVASDRFKHLLLTQPPAARALLRTLDRRIRETQSSGQTGTADAGPPMRRSQLMRAQKLSLTQLVASMSFLRQVELFADLSTPALANLAGIAQEIAVYQGDTLFEQGDLGESLYLVCAGSIAIEVDGRQLAVLERNACLGEMALISGLPRSATATALSEGRLLRIGSDDFASLLSTEPEISLALLKTLSRRLRNALARRDAGG